MPVTGAAEAEFVLHDQKVFFEPGGICEIDNLERHGTTNHGRGYRTNLMLDYCPAASLEARNAPSPAMTPPATWAPPYLATRPADPLGIPR